MPPPYRPLLTPVFQFLAWLTAGLFFLFQSMPADASAALEQWRTEANNTRRLADNNAQQAWENAQRLRETLPADAEAADRVRQLNLLSRAETYLGLSEAARQHAEQALATAKQYADRTGQTEANLNIALNAAYRAKLDALFAAPTHALETADSAEHPELLAEAMLRQSMVFLLQEKIEESVSIAAQSLEIALRSQSPLAMAYAHQGMAISYDLGDQPTEAQHHFSEMLEWARRAQSALLEGEALLGLASQENKSGNFSKSESLMEAAIERFRAVGAIFSIAQAKQAQAEQLRSRKRPLEALSPLGEAIAIHTRHSNKIGLVSSLLARSAIHLTLHRLPEAHTDALRGNALAGEIGLDQYLLQSVRLLAQVHAAQGLHQEAYQYQTEAEQIAGRMARERNGAHVAELTKRYRNESRQREIDKLTRHNEQQDARQRWLWTVFGGSLLLLAITALFLFRLRRSNLQLATLNHQLEQSRNRLQATHDALPDLLFELGLDGRYYDCHASRKDLLAAPASELIGKTIGEVLPPEVTGPCMDAIREANENGISTTRQYALSLPGGTFWFEISIARKTVPAGEPPRFIGLSRDITERKRVEQELEQHKEKLEYLVDERTRELARARDDAEAASRAKSDFLAHMSHELRTPLNSILGYTQILLQNPSLEPSQATGLRVIQQSGEQLLTLINDILDLAKIEAGRLITEVSAVPTQPFLRSVADTIAIRAEQRKLHFACETDPDLPAAILADERLLRQVLLNLLSNAIKFTEQGKVTLRVTMAQPQRLRFAVEDTGIGIPPEQQERIFHPFEQAGDTHQRFGGTGLGLSISRGFVRQMGSDIQVESRPGAGSTFWFELAAPSLAPPVRPPAAVEKLAIGYHGPRKKVLIVDDVAENRDVLVYLLEPLGFKLIEAGNARQGIESAQTHHPDLILMDTCMPEMDGNDAIRRLRAEAAFRETPIIVVSASATNGDRTSAVQAGANAFLAKPFQLDELLKLIVDLLHIELNYAPRTGRTEPVEQGEPLVPLPREELLPLHLLAQQGDLPEMARRLEQLRILDQRYHPFIQRLHELATNFQSQAILALIEQHLKPGKP